MLTILLLGLLIMALYVGARRGFVLQIVYSVGYMISFLFAKQNYKLLAPKLELFIPYPSATMNSHMVFFDKTIALDLDKSFYHAISFCFILFLGWLATRFIGIFFHSLTYLPFLHEANSILGALLNGIVVYLGLVIVLNVLILIPLDSIQNQFKPHTLATFIVEKTPIFSKKIYDLWVNQVLLH